MKRPVDIGKILAGLLQKIQTSSAPATIRLYGQTVRIPRFIIFSGGLWTAGFRATPETGSRGYIAHLVFFILIAPRSLLVRKLNSKSRDPYPVVEGVNHCRSHCRSAKFRGLMYGGKIQRCDWRKITHSLEIHTGHIKKDMGFSTNHSAVFPPVHHQITDFRQTTV
jgi:hypothetical protein